MPQVTDFPEITRLGTGDYIYTVPAAGGNNKIKVGNMDFSPNSNKIIAVNSVEELKNISTSNLPNNSKAYVKSYYADYSDDGLGGGHFYWKAGSSATEDSGRYFKPIDNPSAGRWERLLHGEMANIRMFGAKAGWNLLTNRLIPSHAHDCTSGIQNALNACRYGWSERLHFPCGGYKITDTLLWDAQQTNIIGDGCVNNTCIWMDTGINKDMFISYGYSNLVNHNNNPTPETNPATINLTNDIPKMSRIAIQYAGPYHRDSVSPSVPIQNDTNSILTFTLPGETNHIDEVLLEGGKYAIRVIGPQGPGLRLTNSTINAQGDASISIEAGIYYNTTTSQWTTGFTFGLITVDNCSTDYRGINLTGFSFIKSHKGCIPQIMVKDLKVEGAYGGGVIQYVRPSSYKDAFYGGITLDGINFNQTESDTAFGNIGPVSVVDIRGDSPQMEQTVHCNLKNMLLFDVDYVIRDYILRNDKNEPFVIYPNALGGLNQMQNVITPLTHGGYIQTGRYPTNEAYRNTSFINNNFPDELMVAFSPTGGTGWYRIMEGNLSNSAILNYNLSISNFYEVHKLNIFSDMTNRDVELKSVSSHTNPALNNKIITRARLLYSAAGMSTSPSVNPVFLDVFVNNTGFMSLSPSEPNSQHIRVSYQRMNSPHAHSQKATNLLVPIHLTGTSEIKYQDIYSRYAEVDMSRTYDRSLSNQVGTRILGTTLIQKDIHLYADANREVKIFDAGAKVTFAGGGGANAAGDPVFVGGVLKNVILTNSGNGGYTSFPTISITPSVALNGTGAFASGQVVGGYISRVHILSGGAGYCAGPSSNSVGYSLTGIQTNSVLTTHIADSNITTAKIASDAVTTVKILDSNVTTAKIADNNVTTAKINNSAITTAKINDLAVTAAKLDITGVSPLIPKDSVSSSVRRLIIQNSPSSPDDTVLITADEIVLKNPSGLSYLANAPVINVKISNAGAGGLDNGDEANSAWYGIWGIYNSGSNLVSGVLSRADGRNFNYLGTSSSDATYGFGPLMPGTYSYKALLGHVYNKANGNFNTFYTLDRSTYINDTVLFYGQNPTTSNTYQFYQTGLGVNSVNLTGLIPRNSVKLNGNVSADASSPGGIYTAVGISANPNGLGAVACSIFAGNQGAFTLTGTQDYGRRGSCSFSIPLTGWGFWWKNTSPSFISTISVNGYEI